MATKESTTEEMEVTTTEAKPKAAKATKASKPAKMASNGAFSVIMTGGKQYKVSVGNKLKIEKIMGDHKEGDAIVFDQVLMTCDGATTVVGAPTVAGSKVAATISKIARHPKITVIKYKQKSRYFKKNGHKQPYFEVTINSL